MIQMNSSVQVVAVITSIALAALVLWLIRKGRLREETALCWLLAAGLLLLFSLRRDFLEWTAAWLGIYYPPSLLLLGVILAGTLLAIHFSITLARLSDQNRRMAQELALLGQGVLGEKQPLAPLERESGVAVLLNSEGDANQEM